jgi:glucose/mannose-6-phosphate isomerase
MSFGVGSVLDEVAALDRRDPGGIIRHIGELPRQLEAGWRLTREMRLPEGYRQCRAIAVLGMGGSAIAGDIVRGIFSDRLRAPLVSVRDYELPAWVGRDTLVVAVSHSGATEETISAVSAALERRCPVVAVTTGGPLGEVTARVDLPRVVYPADGPPRVALGYTLAALTGILQRADLLDVGEQEVTAAAAGAATVARACGPKVSTEGNLAKQLAWTLVDRLPVVEAGGFLAPVARRWKTQLNENAKVAAVAEELPEATHNTVVGYEQPDTLRDHLYVLFLAGSFDHPRNSLRLSLSTELLATAGIAYQVVPLGGDSRFEQACWAITLGDYVSAYLALLYGVDPTPVEAITHIKEGMRAADQDNGE